MKYDYLIVGAGFAGCVSAERIASQLNKKVLIVEKRNHIGGNCFDYSDSKGILVHKYGPHAFHTSMKNVWDYLSGFTKWHHYEHKVLAHINGKNVPIPFNINSIEQIFDVEIADKYKKILVDSYGEGKKIPILKLKETNNPDLRELADFIYQNVFYGYTLKQWGMEPEELDFSVTSRVPVLTGRDDRYFQDIYQGIPAKGYTQMFKNIIEHPNIEIMLNKDYRKVINQVEFDKMIYTGPIDSFFDYKYGKLPYRSLRFDHHTLRQNYFQEVAQVNYPNNHQYTRITEFKHFLNQKNIFTTIAYEYPQEYEEGVNEPYYPIPRKENDEIYKKYFSETEKISDKVIFLGRLAEYKYYNMDQIVGVSLLTFEKKIKSII
ncbi:UDP-galactopyranose mutase [Bacteroidetes/Chlorobi group bacterium ChocPot_Mid]|jgi:UDP-galactopyranose mutase|nr:MAG: UDP-galactopyranose mutase [Bacteroidetes/Chlorobi group bacterium ChocPot_Mid]